jgi:hypothetical protein
VFIDPKPNAKLVDGAFEEEVQKAYLTMDYKKMEAEGGTWDQVQYTRVCLEGAYAPPPWLMAERQEDGTYVVPDGECLYMDVGCWCGNGPESREHYERHREFGVVCGTVAALCSFAEKDEKGNAPKPGQVKFVQQDHNDALENSAVFKQRIEPFLKDLSKELNGSAQGGGWRDAGAGKTKSKVQLGGIYILSAFQVTKPQFATEHGTPVDDPTLYVFLGDLHLPVIRNKKRTYIRSLKNRAAAEHASPEEQASSVLRAGRLHLDALVKAQLKAAEKEVVDWTADGKVKPTEAAWSALKGIGLFLSMPEAVRPAIIRHDIDVAKRQRLGKWDPEGGDGLESAEEAGEWADKYRGTDGARGADIFQDAHHDLLQFLARIEQWAKTNKQAKVHLVQTGDLLDLWIGLKLGFGPDVRRDAASAFAGFWYQETLKAEGTGEVLEWFRRCGRLQDFDLGNAHEKPDSEPPPANLKVTVLYGNHDNYMRDYGHPPREPRFEIPSSYVIAEHGHQWDGWTCDEKAWQKGWPLTQVCFQCPDLRAREDMVSAGLSEATGSHDRRLDYFTRAAEVCLQNGKLIYVMGHTHRRMLRRIKVKYIIKDEPIVKDALRRVTAQANSASAAAGKLLTQYQEAVGSETARAEEHAKHYARARIEEARRRLTRAESELKELAESTEFEKDQKKAIQDARRKVTEANSELARLGSAPDAETRRKAEKISQHLMTVFDWESLIRARDLEVEDDLELPDKDLDYVDTVVKGDLMTVRRRLRAAGGELEFLGSMSQTFGSRVVDKENQQLEKRLEQMKEHLKKILGGMKAPLEAAYKKSTTGAFSSETQEAHAAQQKVHVVLREIHCRRSVSLAVCS